MEKTRTNRNKKNSRETNPELISFWKHTEIYLFPSPPYPQELLTENEVFLSTSVCSIVVVSSEMDKLHYFSAVTYQAFWDTQKPAQEPGESWARLTQGILQEVGLHLGICKGEEEDWKERKPRRPIYVNSGFLVCFLCGKEKEGKLKWAEIPLFLLPCPFLVLCPY